MTRKWIDLKAQAEEEGDDKQDKIDALNDKLEALDVRGAFKTAINASLEHGRGHIYLDTGDTLVAGSGFDQSYNAQAAVAADSLLVVAVDVTQEVNDKRQVEPMLEKLAALPESLGKVETLRTARSRRRKALAGDFSSPSGRREEASAHADQPGHAEPRDRSAPTEEAARRQPVRASP